MKKIIVTLSLITALSLPAIAAEEGEHPERPARPEPADVAKDWITQHDANGNGTLEETELTAAFEAAQERRGERPRMSQRGPKGPRGPQALDGKRPERPERPERAQREPGQRLGTMVERFDTDGDKALNEAELKEALTAMHKMQRRGPQGPRGPRGPMMHRGPGHRAPAVEAETEG